MTDFIKKVMILTLHGEKAKGQYGRVADAVRLLTQEKSKPQAKGDEQKWHYLKDMREELLRSILY